MKRLPKVSEIVVVQDDKKNKKFLIRVNNVMDGDDPEIQGIIEKDRHIKSQRLTFKPSQIVVNLGKNPSPGMVYGLDASRVYLGRKKHDSFGELHFFIRPTDDQWSKFQKSMDRVTRRLEKMNLGCLLSAGLSHEIHHKKGKYAGMFYKSSNTDEVPHRIEYFIDCEVESYDYLLSHELGHYLHMVGLASYPKINQAWIRLYNQTILPMEVEHATLEKHAKSLSKQDLCPSAWAKEQDDEAKAELRLMFRWMAQVRSLSMKDLDTLWGEEGDNRDEVLKLLPRCSLQSKDIKPSVSEYATKNVRELFAESFAFYMIRKELPKAIHSLMEKSIPLGRNWFANLGNE